MSSTTQLQLQIRENAAELQSYLQDLGDWEKEIKTRDAKAKDTKRSQTLPPIRGADINVSPPSSPSRATFSSAGKPVEPRAKGHAKDKAKKPTPMVPDLGFEPLPVDAERMERALTEKEIGNTHFKRGAYSASIRHYTAAITLSPRDPVFYLNRAAAHLKLSQHTEAESDCAQALEYDSKNVKALFRRAQARKGMEKWADAKRDLELASVLEPGNKDVKEELERVAEVLRPKPKRPKRRRMLITEVGEEDTSVGGNGAGVEGGPQDRAHGAKTAVVGDVAERSTAKSVVPLGGSAPTATKPGPPAATTVVERAPAPASGKQTALFSTTSATAPSPAPKPSTSTTSSSPVRLTSAASSPPITSPPRLESVRRKVSGPTTFANGTQSPTSAPAPATRTTVATPSPASPATAPAPATPAPVTAALVSRFPPPTTPHEFSLAWRALKNDPASSAAYFKSIPPTTLPSLLRSGVDPADLERISSILHSTYLRSDIAGAWEVLRELAKAPRVAVAGVMVGRGCRKEFEEVFAAIAREVGGGGVTGTDGQEVDKVAKVYGVKMHL